MKILVVSHPCATPSNQEVFGVLQEQTGWELDLVIPAGWRDEFGNRLDEAPQARFAQRVRKIPVWANGNIILHWYRASWRRLLGQGKYDAIYLHHEPYAAATAQVCIANRSLPRPAAFGFYSAQNLRKSFPPPFSWLEQLVFRSSRFAFPVSEEVKRVLEDKGYREEATVCPLAVDLKNYRPRGEAADRVLLPRGEGEVVLGYVGRLVESKGLRTLATALGMLRGLSWRLVVVGTGEFREEFRRLTADFHVAERVEFRGFVPHRETPSFLSAMDVVVVPSETQAGWKEQFGRVVVEAMACGTMVLGSDSGEIPVLIGRSGGGLVFAERDADALARSLRQAISDGALRDSLAADGRRWVERNASTEVVAGRMAGAILSAVSKRTREREGTVR